MHIHLQRLHRLNFDVKEGNITVTMGLSGSGKSPLILSPELTDPTHRWRIHCILRGRQGATCKRAADAGRPRCA